MPDATAHVASKLYLLVLLTLVSTAETSAQEIVLEPNALCAGNPGTAIPTFEDADLEEAIRASIGVQRDHVLTCALFSRSGGRSIRADSYGISRIMGIQNVGFRRILSLQFNKISDLTPLNGLPAIRTLWLTGNRIRDISVLGNLIDLQTLEAASNQIEDIKALRELKHLGRLVLGDNRISDISPLGDLGNELWE